MGSDSEEATAGGGSGRSSHLSGDALLDVRHELGAEAEAALLLLVFLHVAVDEVDLLQLHVC